jgi:hypothetical protein
VDIVGAKGVPTNVYVMNQQIPGWCAAPKVTVYTPKEHAARATNPSANQRPLKPPSYFHAVIRDVETGKEKLVKVQRIPHLLVDKTLLLHKTPPYYKNRFKITI